MNIKNRTILENDNLFVLRGMDSESVDLIYLDPPFNSNRNYSAPIGSEAAGAAFKDTWSLSDVDNAWHGEIAEREPALYQAIHASELTHSKGMKSYLIMMAVRMLEMKRVLKPTGSIYLHCDPTASHYLKLLMDSVFGKDNFRNEIVWHHPKIGIAKNKFTSNTDTILYYSKSETYTFLTQRSNEPNELATRWRKKLIQNKLYFREAQTINDSPAKSKISVCKKTLGRDLKDEDVVVDFNLDQNKKSIDNVWKYSFLRGNSKESVGYPTQKPLDLLERIIKASSNQGDVILDPFCGCATTCVAAEKLGRQWVGIDLSSKAVELVRMRLEREVGMLGEVIHRTDIPQRSEKLQNYRTHKHTLYGQQEGLCNGCRTQFPFRNMTTDHIVARSHGGTDHIENLQLLCGACNSTKGSGTQEVLVTRLQDQGVL